MNKRQSTPHDFWGRIAKKLVLADMIREITITNALEDFHLSCLVDGLSNNTIQYYERNLQDLPEISTAAGIEFAHQLDPQTIRIWLATHKTNPKYNAVSNGNYAVKARWVSARRFFNFCVANRYMIENPIYSGQIAKPQTSKKIPETLSRAEIQRLMDACGKDRSFLALRNRAIIAVFLATAARLNELLDMQLKEVDIDNGLIQIPSGKGDKEGIARLGDKALKNLIAYLRKRQDDKEEYIWLTEERGRLKASGLQDMLSTIAKRAGMKKRVHPHMFRHTFAVEFLRAGGNLKDLQIYGRWSTLDSVKPYLETLSTDDALRAHQRFNPADRML